MKAKKYLLTVLVFALILLSLAMLAINVIAQTIVCKKDFDSGSFETCIVNGNEIELTVSSDGLGYEYWANFKVSGVLDKEVIFKITNADEVPFLTDTEHISQMVYSCDDGENWNRLTDHSYISGTYVFTQTFACNEAQIATFFPFSYKKVDDYVDAVESSEWATKQILGQSHQGNKDIDLLTITNSDSLPVKC